MAGTSVQHNEETALTPCDAHYHNCRSCPSHAWDPSAET